MQSEVKYQVTVYYSFLCIEIDERHFAKCGNSIHDCTDTTGIMSVGGKVHCMTAGAGEDRRDRCGLALLSGLYRPAPRVRCVQPVWG